MIFLCRDSILAAPLALDLCLFMDLAARTPSLRGLGIQEWLSFYFKAPDSAPGVYPEHDLFIQSMKLKNTLRHIMGQDLITHLGLDYYRDGASQAQASGPSLCRSQRVGHRSGTTSKATQMRRSSAWAASVA